VREKNCLLAKKVCVGYRRTGYPERTSKGSLKSHQKTKLEGKPWAPHRPRPSSPGSPPHLEPRTGGLDVLTQSPPHARLLTKGLGKESDLRLTRGLILRIARGRLVHSPSPPASTDLPDSTSCPINASTTPAISAGRWLDTTEWPTGHEVASAPYRLRQGTAGITGHCILTLCPRSAPALHCAPRSPPRKQHDMDGLARVITVSKLAHQINRSLRASALCTRVSATSGFVSTETPPLRCSLGTDRASASRTVSP